MPVGYFVLVFEPRSQVTEVELQLMQPKRALKTVFQVLQLQACANLFYQKGQFSTAGQKQEHWAAREAKLRAQGCRGKLGLDFNALRHEALKKYGSSQLTSPLLLRDVFPFIVNCPVSRVYFVYFLYKVMETLLK